MFKAFAAIKPRRRSWAVLTHGNDNFERSVAAAPLRARTPQLICRWQADATNGRLACQWRGTKPRAGD